MAAFAMAKLNFFEQHFFCFVCSHFEALHMTALLQWHPNDRTHTINRLQWSTCRHRCNTFFLLFACSYVGVDAVEARREVRSKALVGVSPHTRNAYLSCTRTPGGVS